MNATNPARRPTFLWQGLLIVLPAILLAGVGLHSLRKDRALARLDATEAAHALARNLADTTLPAAFNEVVAGLDFSRPDADKHDLVLNAFTGESMTLACEIDNEGELVFPPPVDRRFPHEPLDFSVLPPKSRALWDQANSASLLLRNDRESIRLFDEFIALEPPERFVAIANVRVASSLMRMHWPEEAREVLEKVVNNHSGVRGETGLDLGLLARIRLLQLAAGDVAGFDAEERVRAMAAAIARDALERPSWLTDWILNEVRSAELDFSDSAGRSVTQSERTRAPGSFEWRRRWQAELDARRLHELYAARRADGTPPHAMWLEFQPGQFWFVRPVEGAGGSRWLIAQTASRIQQPLTEAIARHSSSDDFTIGVDFAGRTLTPMGSFSGESAVAHADSTVMPGLSVEAALRDPAAFYQNQEARSRKFGALIGFSVVAVLIGFFAAWRSFQNQIALGEMKSNFVSSVSHELRTPIASVSLMAEELRDLGADDPEQSREYHEFIVKECRRLTALIENILDYSRIERGAKEYEFEPTDFSILVEQTVKSLEAYANEHGVRLETLAEGEAVPVTADSRAIQGSLVNLIDNAIKHSPSDGLVTVALVYDGDRVRLTVRDQGPGIPPADREKVFERFHRLGSELRRETKGTGLGLAIVKHAIDAHDGTVRVTGAEGRGSCFEILLPVGQSSATSHEADL